MTEQEHAEAVVTVTLDANDRAVIEKWCSAYSWKPDARNLVNKLAAALDAKPEQVEDLSEEERRRHNERVFAQSNRIEQLEGRLSKAGEAITELLRYRRPLSKGDDFYLPDTIEVRAALRVLAALDSSEPTDQSSLNVLSVEEAKGISALLEGTRWTYVAERLAGYVQGASMTEQEQVEAAVTVTLDRRKIERLANLCEYEAVGFDPFAGGPARDPLADELRAALEAPDCSEPPSGTVGEEGTILLVAGDEDHRSLSAEYDPSCKLVQFVKWGEEVFDTWEPVEPDEWAEIVRRFTPQRDSLLTKEAVRELQFQAFVAGAQFAGHDLDDPERQFERHLEDQQGHAADAAFGDGR